MLDSNIQRLPKVLLHLDKNELKSIKVAITRKNITKPNNTGPLLRSLEDPTQLKIHFRPDEGVRPIFDREGIIVNIEHDEETASNKEKSSSDQPKTSRSSSRSSRSKSPTRQERKRFSPQPHSSRDYPKDRDYHSSRYRRSSSRSRKVVYKTSRRYSRSPERRRSRGREWTPPNYRHPERRRSRSPGTSRRRSRSPGISRRRSRSPGTSRRRSRSPGTSRRRSRSPGTSRRRSRSRSPYRSRRYSRSPDYHRRSTETIYPPGIPNPYAEFWIPDPMMQPRFIPRQMIPGAFPYVPFRPGLPPMMPPRPPFRPRIVYNRPPRPKVTPVTSTPAIESATVTTTTASKDSEEAHQEEKNNDENK